MLSKPPDFRALWRVGSPEFQAALCSTSRLLLALFPQPQAVTLKAADGANLEALARAAHQFKGSAATLGALRLGRLAESIEAAARASDSAAAGAAMADFRGLAQASRTALG